MCDSKKVTNMNQQPSFRSLEVRDYLLSVFGNPAADVYAHDNSKGTVRVGIIHAPNSPEEGLTTYATVNLNEAPNRFGDTDLRAELIAVVESGHDGFANAIGTVAANCIEDGLPIAPGVVHRNALANYPGLAPQLPHMLMTYPMDYGEEFAEIPTSEGPVYGLQALPISQAEAQFLEEHGFEALEQAFMDAELNYFDLRRASIF